MDPSVAAYCNQVTFNSSELSQALSNVSLSLSTMITEQNSDIIDKFEMQHTIKTEESGEILVLTIEYKIGDTEGKFSFRVEKDGYDNFLMLFTQTVNSIIEGNKAIDKLNKKISEIQSECGATTALEYMWGAERYCKIYDWDYDVVKIKLSKTAIQQLILVEQNGELDNLIRKFSWDTSITEYIKDFVNIALHERINAVMSTSNIDRLLTENMISSEDILPIVQMSKKNKKKNSQKVKVVGIIKELGHFAVVYTCLIDYEKKIITLQIMNDKVYDLDRGRFISDRDIVDRVEAKINISKEAIARMFD